MGRFKVLSKKDNGYRKIRLLYKTFNVKYYDPPGKDKIYEYHIQVKFYILGLFSSWKTIKLYTYSQSENISLITVQNKAFIYFNNICNYGKL